jgi:predicted ATP-grasp superfamily ATP-dependent carboligase
MASAAVRPAVIVTDASERVALHLVRALGRAGVAVKAVELAGRSPSPLAFGSKYCASSQLLPDWDSSPDDWLRGLLAAGAEGDVLIPTCLNAILRVLDNREALSRRYRLLLPSLQALRTANDKWELYGACQKLGLTCPVTYCPQSYAEAEQLSWQISFPVIVKFRNDENLYADAAARYAKAESAEALLAAWQRFSDIQEKPLIQEFVSGDGWGFECLYDADGKIAAGFCHRRLMEYPIGGGPSAVCESVSAPEIAAIGQKVLEALSWRGVAMVEFKRCAKTGKLYVLEVNPRFWGSLPLSEAAGVNFPHLLYQAALGEKISSPDYRVGVRMRLLPTYLLSLWSTFRSAPWSLRNWLPKLSYLLDPRICEGLFSLDDLKPAFAYLRTRMRGL